MILIMKYLVPKGYTGITIFPFIFLKAKYLKGNHSLLNHEKIHLKQQCELLIIPFYLFYLIEFMVRLFQYKNLHKAYRNVSFEREAYFNETNLEYINNRQFWAFLKYLRSYDI